MRPVGGRNLQCFQTRRQSLQVLAASRALRKMLLNILDARPIEVVSNQESKFSFCLFAIHGSTLVFARPQFSSAQSFPSALVFARLVFIRLFFDGTAGPVRRSSPISSRRV